MNGLRLARRSLLNDDLVDLCESAASEEDLDKVMVVVDFGDLCGAVLIFWRLSRYRGRQTAIDMDLSCNCRESKQ